MGTVTLRWLESLLMVGTDSNGHSIVIGKNPEGDPPWNGIKPSDLLLLAAASCSAYDVVTILTKQREPMEDMKVVCSGEQLPEPPYAFTEIHLHYIVTGAINPEKLEKAIQLSEVKYCSVICTLSAGGLQVTSDFEIIQRSE